MLGRRCAGAPNDAPNQAADSSQMSALAVMLKPIDSGWAVILTDGRELARFTGFGAKARALCYMAGCKASRLAPFGR